MSGDCEDAEVAAFLIALRMKGETATELAAAASVMREHMVRWDPGRPVVLDTCGTGGDGTGTFNISTAAALVIAARACRWSSTAIARFPAVAGGRRSDRLGVAVEGDPAQARRCLDTRVSPFACPQFHPPWPMWLRSGGVYAWPTLFNLLGPLANPAGATHQLLGVGRPELLDRMAGALARLGTGRALIVCGQMAWMK